MRWLLLALLGVLAVGVAGGRHLRSHAGGTALQSEEFTFRRALLQAGTDSLVGPLTGENCLFTASSTPTPASQCLLSQNGNFRVCIQTSELVLQEMPHTTMCQQGSYVIDVLWASSHTCFTLPTWKPGWQEDMPHRRGKQHCGSQSPSLPSCSWLFAQGLPCVVLLLCWRLLVYPHGLIAK